MSVLKSSKETTIIQVVSSATVDVGIGIYDPTLPYLGGTIIVDGVRYTVADGRYLILPGLKKGSHTFDIEVPSGYRWDKWVISDWETGNTVGEPTSRPLIYTTNEDTFIKAQLLPPIDTSLTIEAPDQVVAKQTFTVSGTLNRTDTGAGVSGQTIKIYYDSAEFGIVTTDANGGYRDDGVIPEIGTYTLAAIFEETGSYQGQMATAVLGVGVLLTIRERLRNLLGKIINRAQRRKTQRRRFFT